MNNKPFWQRRRNQIFIAIVLLPFVLLFVVTRSFVLAPILESILYGELGTKVTVHGASLDWDGVLAIDELVLVAEDVQGPASNIVTMHNAKIECSSSFMFLDSSIEGIEVDSITLRLAESSTTAGEFNFSSLFATSSGGEGASTVEGDMTGTVTFPPVVVDELIVETGYMEGGTWNEDSTVVLAITDIVQEETGTEMQLTDSDKEISIALTMSSDPFFVRASITDVQLNDDVFGLLPRTAKTWCKEVGLYGAFSTIDISWEERIGFSIEAEISSLQFELPEEHGVRWAGFRDGVVKRIHGKSKLNVNAGSISYNGNEVDLNHIKGSLVPPSSLIGEPLMFSGGLSIKDFGNVGKKEGDEWMGGMLSNAPFRAVFTIHDFSPEEANLGEVRVPLATAQMLKIFQLKQWSMNAKVSIARDEYKGEVTVDGSCFINAAEGEYAEFPYPLKNLSTKIVFHQNDITIENLYADGSGGSSVEIKGTVHASSDDLKVNLDLIAKNAPIDSALRSALPEGLASVVDKVLDKEVAKQVLSSIEEREESSFVLGGKIGLKLLIEHDSELKSDVEITGGIAFKDIGIVHEDFPYPIILRSGYLLLEKDGLHVPEDTSIKFEGYGGGRGYVVGSIMFLENGTAAPAIAMGLNGEEINSALIAAVVEAAGEDNKLASDILEGLGLSTKIEMTGSVSGKDDGSIDTSFNVKILEGSSLPNKKLAEAIHASGPFWPDDFELTGIKAELDIVNGRVEMKGATCDCDNGSVQADMTIDKGEFDLHLTGERLPFSPQFVDVLPESASKKLSRAWRTLEPSGSMDAIIRIQHIEGEPTLNMTIEPKQLFVTTDNRSTEMNLTSGTVQVEGTNVFLNDLQFKLQEKDSYQGEIDISGEIVSSGEHHNYVVDALWDEAVIGSPFARAITEIVGGAKAVEYYDSISPEGFAKASLHATGGAEELTYNIEVIPESLTATFHKRRASAVFEDVQKPDANVIHFYNEGIHFDHLLGRLGDGNISVNGKIESGDYVEGKFDMTWNGPVGDESLFAILPSVVGDVLAEIEMGDGDSSMQNGEVSFNGEDWSNLSVHFNGDILQENVSLDLGVKLEQIHGVTHIEGQYSEEKLSSFKLSLLFEELTTLGRKVTNVVGSLKFDPVLDRFVFEEVRGESETGGVTVDGWLSLDDQKKYELEILVAGVHLATNEDDENVASLEGALTGWISIAGVRGDAMSRRGMGKVAVKEGHLEINPLSLATMRILHLALPSAATIEGAEIELYIEGEKIILDDIILRSGDSDISDLVVSGDGTIDFDTTEIHARLHPRAGLPILRDIAGALNDQFYSIDVTGTLLNPEISVVPLPFLSPHDK
ncbi:MAG: hypothetical protein HOC27_07855 [Phycisphaerae bacterium]|nr:hypothetical protein [Phycisphaerae bacterium]